MSGSTHRQNTPSSGSSTGPPSYTTMAPSTAEMATEIQQLRAMVNTLRGQAYFEFFPTKMASAKARVLLAAQIMEGTAAAWMEPITRDFLENDETTRDQETENIFASWTNFETSLKDAFGLVNEERQAATKIHELRQTRSAAVYAATFRLISSKLEWEDEPLMEIFYQGLKDEVKDELYKADRPDTLTEYIAMAVKIDERQYERRKEKAAHKGRRTTYNPYYPNQFNNRNKGNNGNQGRYQQPNTSYGTRPGPMEIGAVRTDKKGVECYYCHKKGHIARECLKRQREQGTQQHRPLPEGKKPARFVNAVTTQEVPQTAIRTKTIAMTRGLYDLSGTNDAFFLPSNNLYKTKEEAEKSAGEYAKEKWWNTMKRNKEQREKETDAGTITEELQKVTLNHDPPRDNKGRFLQTDEEIKDERQNWHKKAERMGLVRTIEFTPLPEPEPSATASKGTRAIAMDDDPYNASSDTESITIPDRQLDEPPYETQDWLQAQDRINQTPHHDKRQDKELNIRASKEETAHGDWKHQCKPHPEDDPRLLFVDEGHNQLSWLSCYHIHCPTHQFSKETENCYPIRVMKGPIRRPYEERETRGYRVCTWYDNLGVAVLRPTLKVPEHRTDLQELMKKTTLQLLRTQQVEPDTMHQLAAHRWEPAYNDDYVAIYSAPLAHLDKVEKIPKGEFGDDPRLAPTSKDHWQLSWMSCYYKECDEHKEAKELSNSFPVRRPGQSEPAPYIEQEAPKAYLYARNDLNYFDPRVANRLELPWKPKSRPYQAINLEGNPFSYNNGIVDSELDHLKVYVEGQNQGITFDVIPSEGHDLVLGYPWLYQYNPHFDWRTGQMLSCDKEAFEDQRDDSEDGMRSQTPAEDARGVRQEQTEDTPPPKGTRHKRHKGKKRQDQRIIARVMQQFKELEQDLEAIKRTPEEERLKNIPPQYRIYEKLFREELETGLPEHTHYDLEIEFIDGKQPGFSKLYPLNEAQLPVLKQYIEENIRKGYIRESKSSVGYPVMFVPKKNGKLRLCVDFRLLNEITVKDRTPLPLIGELKDRLFGKRFFTALDLKGAYNLIRIKEGHEWKTAFRTKYGLFEYLVMPFGLTNAPAAFQRMINNVLREHLDIFVVCYLDDILIFSDTEEEHTEHVHKVLQTLQDANLLVEPEKSKFHASEVEFLGHIISHNEIRMDPKKLSAVRDWKEPNNVKEVQAFLGFANYYRKFLKRFGKIAIPLTELTKKDKPFVMGDKAKEAFRDIKKLILSEPVLKMFDPSRPIELETDASDFALGAQLGQRDDEGKLHPIAFYSHKLHGAELNYPIYDKEFLAIVNAFKEFRHYLIGSPHRIMVFTDHKNIVHFAKTQELSGRQLRYAEYLSEFDYVIIHVKGTENGRADAISRRSDLDTGKVKAKEQLLQFTKEGHLTQKVIACLRSYEPPKHLTKEWKEKIISEITDREVRQLLYRNADLVGSNQGMITFRKRIYIPTSCFRELIQHCLKAYNQDYANDKFWDKMARDFVLEQYLRCYINYDQTNWVEKLPAAQLAYNTATNESTKITPAYANFGFNPDAYQQARDTVINPKAILTSDQLKNLHEEMKTELEFVRNRMTTYANKKRIEGPTFSEGDMVYFATKNIQTKRQNKKLDYKYIGPYKIKRKIKDTNYELDLPPKVKLHPIVHISLLESAKDTIQVKTNNEPDTQVDGPEEYIVEAILDMAEIDNKTMYFVKWKDYPDSENTWEPPEHLSHAQRLLKGFHQQLRTKKGQRQSQT
ncbi:hypothetical protein ACJ41O_000317 [Fusarium nematophilum]